MPTTSSNLPLLAKLATKHSPRTAPPNHGYNAPEAGVFYQARDTTALALTGSQITEARGDPTSDEATDR